MRDRKTTLEALQDRDTEHKSRGPATKKPKRAAATAVSVDSKEQLLHGKRVLLVPLGPDMSRKRLEILQGMVHKLGGHVVDAPAKMGRRSTSAGPRDAAALVTRKDCDLIIASAGLKHDKAVAFLHAPAFPPPDIEVYTPEWLVYLVQNKELPPDGLLLTWSEQQRIRDEAAKHEQHCAEVAQQVAEKRGAGTRNDSDSDEGSKSENSDTQEIVRAAPVTMDKEVLRARQADLDEKNRKVVEERVPVFYQNNPTFRPITEGASASSRKVIGEGFICQRSSGRSLVVGCALSPKTCSDACACALLQLSIRTSTLT